MSRRLRSLAAWLAVTTVLVACGRLLGIEDLTRVDSGPADGGSTEAEADDPDRPFVPASKVDVLVAVDNSASMGDKSKLLAASVKELLRNLAPVGDLHVGVLTTSLGGQGGDICPSADGAATASDGQAHLVGADLQGVSLRGVVRFGGAAPTVSNVGELATVVERLVAVGENGCGLEAQLESIYRFLVAPDPPRTIRPGGSESAGVDDVLLRQRQEFLRPDSLVVVLLVTDEDDASLAAASLGGRGWQYAMNSFPGSPTVRPDGKTTTAPRATSVCATAPGSPDCRSCRDVAECGDPDCLRLRKDPSCVDGGGWYASDAEAINARFFEMKRRYGVDPLYPIVRYVDGLTRSTVPRRDGEHPAGSKSYVGVPECTNPLFAETLPASASEELCKLTRGPRSRRLVQFALLGGVVPSLASASPIDWTKLIGRDPDAYDRQGQDAHMIQSIEPRVGLQAPAPYGDNGADPVHGREYDTNNDDLQYACTFPIAPRACQPNDPSCDCITGNRPLCGADAGVQTRAKAYPAIRPLRVAKGLGDRATIASVCVPGSYAETMNRLSAVFAPLIAVK